MQLQEYGLKINHISMYAPHMVFESRAKMNKFLYRVSYLMKTKCRNAMLPGYMNISRLITHAEQVQGDKRMEHAKQNKKAGTRNYDYSQQSVSCAKTYPTCPKYGKNHQGECLI